MIFMHFLPGSNFVENITFTTEGLFVFYSEIKIFTLFFLFPFYIEHPTLNKLGF